MNANTNSAPCIRPVIRTLGSPSKVIVRFSGSVATLHNPLSSGTSSCPISYVGPCNTVAKQSPCEARVCESVMIPRIAEFSVVDGLTLTIASHGLSRDGV
jgi:hypothetical protein